MAEPTLKDVLTELSKLRADVAEDRAGVAKVRVGVAEVRAGVAEVRADVAAHRKETAAHRKETAKGFEDLKELASRSGPRRKRSRHAGSVAGRDIVTEPPLAFRAEVRDAVG